jgi:hypothetical protein
MVNGPTFAWTHSHISYLYRMKGRHAASVEERATANDLLDLPENAKKLRESFAAAVGLYLGELLSQDWGRPRTSRTRRAVCLRNGQKEKQSPSHDAAATGDWWLFRSNTTGASICCRRSTIQAVLKKLIHRSDFENAPWHLRFVGSATSG